MNIYQRINMAVFAVIGIKGSALDLAWVFWIIAALLLIGSPFSRTRNSQENSQGARI